MEFRERLQFTAVKVPKTHKFNVWIVVLMSADHSVQLSVQRMAQGVHTL